MGCDGIDKPGVMRLGLEVQSIPAKLAAGPCSACRLLF
jgi:hypothetical protein